MEGAYSDNSYLVRLDQAEGYVTPRNPKIGGFIGEQRENGSILGKLFGQEVQKPALAMSNTKKIEKPSFTSKIMSNFI